MDSTLAARLPEKGHAPTGVRGSTVLDFERETSIERGLAGAIGESEPITGSKDFEDDLKNVPVQDTLEVDNGTSSTSDENYLTGHALFTLMVGLTMAAFLLMIDSTVLVTAIPTITSAFNSLDDVGWYGSSYLLTT